MAITLIAGQIAQAEVSGGTTVTATLPNNPAPGNLVVAVVSAGGNRTFTVVDGATSPNNYTATTKTPFFGSGVNSTTGIFYFIATSTANKAVTLTCPGPNTTADIFLAEFTGNVTSSPLESDATNSTTVASTAVNLPSITTTNNGDLLIAGVAVTGLVSTANSPWTGWAGGVPADGDYAAYYIQPTAGAQAVNFTMSSGEYVAIEAAFTAAPSTSGGAIYDAGITFTNAVIYYSITQPTFVPPPTWGAWTQWPDLVPTKAKPVVDFRPWTFIEPAPQVWFPPPIWADFARLRTGQIDTQPLAFVPVVTATPTFTWSQTSYWPDRILTNPADAMKAQRWKLAVSFSQVWYPPGNWPDLISARARPVEFAQPTFVPVVVTVPAPVMPWTRWPDLNWRKPQLPDTQPSAFVPVVVIVPAPVMAWTSWPDFAPRARPPVDPQSLAFMALPPSATVIQDWPDFVRRTAQANFSQLAFVPLTAAPPAPTWTQWSPWPDVVPVRARPVADFRPWSFIEPPPQVWFPPIVWPDFLLRKPSPVDTQPSAFVSLVVVQTPTVVTQWPDFVRAKAAPLNYNPLAFVQTVTTPVNGFIQWPDFVYRKAAPLNFDPLTLVQTVKTPWNTLTTWPDFAPIRGRAGLHAALQQFSAKYPGTITAATVNAIMSAFETNSDTATFAIYVIGGTNGLPAVTARVSIQEIGGNSATSVHEAGNT